MSSLTGGAKYSDLAVEMRSGAGADVVTPVPNEPMHDWDRIEEAQRLLDMATEFRRDGWADNARRYARRALSIFERESGSDPRDIVRALLCLAGAREDLLDHARAAAEYRRASDVLDRVSESLEARALRISTMRGLARTMLALGQDPQAETMLKRALAMAQEDVSQPSDVATVLDDLGALRRRAGLHEEASRLQYEALRITERTLGREHPQAATILHHLAILEYARGRFADGEPCARRSAIIWEKELGPDHPRVAAALTSLAALLDRQRKYFEAKQMDRRARTILERWFGRNIAEVAGTPARGNGYNAAALLVTPGRSGQERRRNVRTRASG